jgi:hypothetical protein
MRICRSAYRAGGQTWPANSFRIGTKSPECLLFRPSSRRVPLDRIVFGDVRHQRMMSRWQKQCSAIQHSFIQDRLVQFARVKR